MKGRVFLRRGTARRFRSAGAEAVLCKELILCQKETLKS